MSHEPGILISFEGSEGCGKSTQIRRLADRLEEVDHRDVVVTREPGGTVIGEDIRHLLMHADSSKNIFPETELLLFAASRAQLVREIIYPAVQDGKIVLCDRFLDSTTVYQGVARQIADDPVTQINAFAVGDVVPDLTVILDVPAEVGLERIKHRVLICRIGWNRKMLNSMGKFVRGIYIWRTTCRNVFLLLMVWVRLMTLKL